jgi:hypothetical protein
MATGQDYLKYVSITSEVALLPVTVATGQVCYQFTMHLEYTSDLQ